MGRHLGRSYWTWCYRLRWALGMLTEKERALLYAWRFVFHNQIPGDYVELGVSGGTSLCIAYHWARLFGQLAGRQMIGIDSFAGLPLSAGVFHQGQFAATREYVTKRLQRAGVEAVLVRGWFADLPALPTTRIAVALIDCDLYESTVEALRLLTPALQDGTVLLFDDWWSFKAHPWEGEQRAFHEWRQAHPEWLISPFYSFVHGQAFLLHEAVQTSPV